MRTDDGRPSNLLAWPLVLGALGVVALAGLYVIVPRLERGWADTGRRLTWFEAGLVRASHFVIGWPWVIGLALVVLAVVAGVTSSRQDRREGS